MNLPIKYQLQIQFKTQKNLKNRLIFKNKMKIPRNNLLINFQIFKIILVIIIYNKVQIVRFYQKNYLIQEKNYNQNNF